MKNFEDFINESDYRNVTGNGTMGGSGDQNTGPSFNKGALSATYRLPTVVGVETDDISDPYFAEERQQKRKRIKKHPNIEKNRKNKTKYLDNLDKKTQGSKIEENKKSNMGLENEGVKWYSKGKFEKDDNFERDDTFKIGDKIYVDSKMMRAIYWNNDNFDIDENKWRLHSMENYGYVIDDIGYCQNKNGYTGQIIKIKDYWPWFQVTNFIKKD